MDNPSFRDFEAQGKEIRNLQSQIRGGRMVHALLISGETGTGKRTLAHVIAAALLCNSKEEQPCGRCNGCTRAFDHMHPDMIIVEKGIPLSNETRKSKTTIPIDDIREVIRQVSAYPLEGGNRVILIINAEDMTPQAQNCLLKILEEPPDNTYFILTSAHPEKLLVTIRSRCQFLKMKPWDEKQIIRILLQEGIEPDKARMAAASSRGSIGSAEQLSADEDYWKTRDAVITAFFRRTERSGILSVSSQWKENKANAEILFDILEECISLMLQYRIGNAEDDRLNAFSDDWKKFAANADHKRFTCLLDSVSKARKQYASNVSIQAIVEQLLLSFMGEI